jgi:hypothetical protein
MPEFGLGNQRSTIRIIRRRAALLEVRIEDRFAGRATCGPGHLGESRFSIYSTGDVVF